jgi:hypothetical protein
MITISINQVPTYLVFIKSTFYARIRTLNKVPPSVTVLMCEKSKFKSALRKYLKKHFFHSADEFLCVNMICDIFVKCF